MDIPIEKQEDIVLTKKTRTTRAKKNADKPVTVVDVVMASSSVTVSVRSKHPSIIFTEELFRRHPQPLIH